MQMTAQEITQLVQTQRDFFETGATKGLAFRQLALLKLHDSIKKREEEISRALYSDLHKSAQEAYLSEVGIVLHELRHLRRKLGSYTKNQRVRTGLAQFPASSYLAPEPYGSCLIMSPWNYPFQLAMVPLIGAVAAGNTVVLKPSKDAPHTNQVLADIIQEVFLPGHVSLVTGGREENTALLAQRFDYIFFTGSVAVGKVVMEAASRHLTPVTLELGGKSPVIVHQDANLKLAARRIAFGKLLNAGQTCVAPDYLLVHQQVKDKLLALLKQEITAMLAQPETLAHIINQKHVERLQGLLANEARVWGGQIEARRMQPALVELDSMDSPLMQEEIFGPILPVLSFATLEEAIGLVKQYEKPLALYLFAQSSASQQEVLQHLSFGGGCINDTVLHYSNLHLPFGGVGHSGMGSYHGKRSFDTFTHYRGILRKHRWPDLSARYLPYTAFKHWLTRLFLR